MTTTVIIGKLHKIFFLYNIIINFYSFFSTFKSSKKKKKKAIYRFKELKALKRGLNIISVV